MDTEEAYTPATPATKWVCAPWWVFWRPKWHRRVYRGWDWDGGWDNEYATDADILRQTLEDRFGRA